MTKNRHCGRRRGWGGAGPQYAGQFKASSEFPAATTTYFTGTAAVAWLRQKRHYTQEGAVLVGQWLLQKGLIYPMADDGDFEEGPNLYQFYRDSPAALAKSVESPTRPTISDQNDTEIYSPEAD